MGRDDMSARKAKRAANAREREIHLGKNIWLAHSESDGPVQAGFASASLEDMVRWASTRNDGWLRIVPDSSGEVHWKWRFTFGKWKGHYAYFRQLPHQSATEGWTGLAGRLDSVDEGTLKPSKDVY